MGTKSGDEMSAKYNEVIRVATIEHAMIAQLQNPPKGFENVIRTHFYLKQHYIISMIEKWIAEGESNSGHQHKLSKLLEEFRKEVSRLSQPTLFQPEEEET